MRLRLFVPGHADSTTGGHAYNRRLLDALCRAGHDAAAIPLAGVHPLADDTARDAAAMAWRDCPADCVRLIDGAALAAFLPLLDALVALRAAALVHHPTSLEAGFDEAAHAALRATEQTMLKRLDRVVVTSDAVAQPLAAAFDIDRARIAVVPPGIDPGRRSHGSGGPQCRILTLGALTPRKGHDVLLRALASLFDLDWHLTIVGTTERHSAHATALRALAEESGVAQQVTFAGIVEDRALEEIWDSTDLFALATHWEATPWATMQAFRHGVPVVVSSGGAAADCVTLQNGLVVTQGDVTLLAKALRRVIFDSTLRAGLAEQAWNTGCALPDWNEQAKHLATLFTVSA